MLIRADPDSAPRDRNRCGAFTLDGTVAKLTARLSRYPSGAVTHRPHLWVTRDLQKYWGSAWHEEGNLPARHLNTAAALTTALPFDHGYDGQLFTRMIWLSA